MTTQAPPSPSTPSRSTSAVEVHELGDLAAILDPRVHIAIWHRPRDARIERLFAAGLAGFGRHSRLVRRSADPQLAHDVAGLLPAPLRERDASGCAALVADATLLCEAFAELVSADELMISFEEPVAATCPRFHVDRVGIRMLVTYCGPGTEWLRDEHVDRRWLGEAGMARADDANGVMRPGALIEQAPTFAVVLLKGEAWPGADGFGAVHRSPDPAGWPRTLLRVDLLSQLPLDVLEEA